MTPSRESSYPRGEREWKPSDEATPIASERRRRRTMSRLAGWANKDRRWWPSWAESLGLVLDSREREGYVEWQVSTTDGDTIGFVHEFPDRAYAYTFTGWPVRWWNRLRRPM